MCKYKENKERNCKQGYSGLIVLLYPLSLNSFLSEGFTIL